MASKLAVSNSMTNVAIDVLCCPVSAIDAELLAQYKTLLNAAELQRYDNFRAPAAQREFLIARALLRTELAARLQCEPQALEFIAGTDGKPALAMRDAPWQFNLSHARDWIVLAIGTAGAIGVDVEYHERRNQMAGIARRFFSAQENRALAALDDAQRQQRFFELWTLKEAYVKALGRGIATALAGTDLEYLSANNIALHVTGAARCDGDAVCWHYALAPSYSLAVAQIGAPPTDELPRFYRAIPLREQRVDNTLAPLRTARKVFT